MAHTKAQGATRQQSNRPGKRRGIKRYEGEFVTTGTIIIRQVGLVVRNGDNVGRGKDFTLFAEVDGVVKYYNVNKNKKAVKVFPAKVEVAA